jgi:rhodanese-related sulfurtransferase
MAVLLSRDRKETEPNLGGMLRWVVDSCQRGARNHAIRTPGEFAADRIPGARNIDFESSSFRQELAAFDRDRTYVVYCRSGGRSPHSLATFRELGFKKVLNVKGGLNAWRSARLPVEVHAPVK